MNNFKRSIFWFRRDLRLEDNHGLWQALKASIEVIPLFIFDRSILDKLKGYDRRVDFIHQKLMEIDQQIRKTGGSGLLVCYGTVSQVWKQVLLDINPQAVFCNHDYEPSALKRDMETEIQLESAGISFKSYKDQVIFEENELVKNDGLPYTVYTPYSRTWKNCFNEEMTAPYPSEKLIGKMTAEPLPEIPPLEELGFQQTDLEITSPKPFSELVNYDQIRDFPALNATSRLSVHLRFGTVSIRQIVKMALKTNGTFLNELIWREFFMMILYHFPKSATNEFREKYSSIEWRSSEEDFIKWTEGTTGYPLVDAGMRELNSTGFMHNRVRMVTASFLVKHLLIDWRRGERYFAEKLLDFDLSANVGNWQWAAGTGCDAAPYFRIFNPASQTEKFDKNYEYIKKWLPEFGTTAYPSPVVEHKFARERALKAYKAGINFND